MKSCDVTIQMKPLQQHFKLVLFASKYFPKKKKLEIWPYFDYDHFEDWKLVSFVIHAWAYHASNVLPNTDQ